MNVEENDIHENQTEGPAPESTGESPKSDTVTFKLKKHHVVVLSVFLALLLSAANFAAGYYTHSLIAPETPTKADTDSNTLSTATNADVSTAAASSQTQPVFDFVDDDPALGPEDAPITIVEFSDFECPYCKRWHEQTFKQLLNMYEGKIRFVYRDFPLHNIHPRAQIAAEAAECADDQGMYWPMHDILFNDQAAWSKTAPNPVDRFKIYALQLGMDADELLNCIDRGTYTQEVQFDLRAGASYGITGTPAFIINGKLLSGAHPLETFQMVLDRELAAIEAETENE